MSRGWALDHLRDRGVKPPSGHVFRVERARGPVWYAKYRLPEGRQVQKKLGPAWSGRGRPPTGYFTRRLAEDWLRGVLDEARRGTLPGAVRTGATFADAAAEFLRYAEQDRGCKPSTLRDYRSNLDAHLLPTFGSQALESIPGRDRRLARLPPRPLGTDEEQAARRHARRVSTGSACLEHWRQIPWPQSRSIGSGQAATSMCSRLRRCSLSSALPARCRTAPSTLSRPSRVCAAASCWRCAGVTSTSPARSSVCAPRRLS